MIAEMGISPLALLDISAQSQRLTSRSLWAAWLEILRAHGSLVFMSGADFVLMKDLLGSSELTPDEKKRWTEMLVFLKANDRFRIAEPGLAVHLDEVDTPQEISSVRAQLPLVAVLAHEAFERLYPDSDTGSSAIDDHTSASVTGAVSAAPVMEHLHAMSLKERYPTGSDRDLIWHELFEDLTTRSKRIVIVDRYAFSELSRRRGHNQNRLDPEHLAWLLTKIDRYAPAGSRVQIFTQLVESPQGTQTASHLERLLREAWAPGRMGSLRAIDLFALVWDTERHPHNRHIRFGDSWGFKLDEGLDRLSRPAVRDPDGFNYTFMWRTEHLNRFKSRERLVQNDPLVQRATWTVRR